jgi:peptidoglycan/xylan/chitin deacetylase (PgdA/CDA1 family)
MPDDQNAKLVHICFHGIGTPSQGLSTADERYFVGKDLFLAVLDDVLGKRYVELSFDDGYASDVEIALPAVTERGLSARFFPVAGHLGRPGYLDTSAVHELASSGMTVGSHGMWHRPWRRMEPQELHEELVHARRILEAAAGAPIDSAACPLGAYDRRVLASLREHGYVTVFTSDRRRGCEGAWLQPRYSVRRDDTIHTVRDGILTRPRLAERARTAAASRVKAWR